ncbi:DIE2/ALG10 family-domain-containing protein [Tricladium varicosporioides]|nr:DIE2/ALG10 family-domain-containing protein [Hymenoscyphus varicosporioides]
MVDWSLIRGSTTVRLLVTETIIFANAPFYWLNNGSRSLFKGSAFIAVYLLARLWQRQASAIVPEPYLDEVFHIPQAQAYCDQQFSVWDPKLTTPPGLYAFAVIFGNILPGGCTASNLRLFNVFALLATMSFALECRTLITERWKHPSTAIQNWKNGLISSNSLHTVVNVALFPPLFFFSGLFYTDILSTCIVVWMYKLFLQGQPGVSGLKIYFVGALALTMRQTNIFWVAIFIGGLEAVRTIKANARLLPVPSPIYAKPLNLEGITSVFKQFSRGQIHDIPLKDAGVHDFILCAISIAVAVINWPILILTSLAPYIALLLSFGAFVFWNGGVVLGDKANHIATIHLPQLLYLLPFTTFFAFPIITPSFLTFALSLPNSLATKSIWKILLAAIYTLGALITILGIIKFNTIIHPFTLADNRHYVFYVFRYSILKHPLMRYVLAPIYLVCGLGAYLTLCSSSIPMPKVQGAAGKKKQEAKSTTTQMSDSGDEGPTTSWLIVFLITTALSLITAPLVEPRYFIIPFVIWRLNIPPSSNSVPAINQGGLIGTLQIVVGNIGLHSMWVETAWYLLIDAVTCYIFLYKGFEWKQEPGNVQRFMW